MSDDLPPATIWRRSAAGLIDSLVGLSVWVFCAMWFVIGFWWLRGLPVNPVELLILVEGVGLLGLALHLVYHVVLVGGCGQTLGRMAMGVAVVDRAGAAPGYWRAIRRSLGGLLSMLTLGLASLPFLFSRDRRGLGDRLAGTRVVLLGPGGAPGHRRLGL